MLNSQGIDFRDLLHSFASAPKLLMVNCSQFANTGLPQHGQINAKLLIFWIFPATPAQLAAAGRGQQAGPTSTVAGLPDLFGEAFCR